MLQLAARIRSEGRANVHLSKQHRAILQALRDGMELTTKTSGAAIGVCAITQRGGELRRMGLVEKERIKVVDRAGVATYVVRLNLTDLGRTVSLDFGSAQDDAQTEIPMPAARQARRIAEDLFGNQGLSDG